MAGDVAGEARYADKPFSLWEKVAEGRMRARCYNVFTRDMLGAASICTAPSSVCCAATFSQREKGWKDTAHLLLTCLARYASTSDRLGGSLVLPCPSLKAKPSYALDLAHLAATAKFVPWTS